MTSKAGGNDDIELYLIEEIYRYLNELPMEQQVQLGIVSFLKRIPSLTEEQKLDYISGIINYISLEAQGKYEQGYKIALLSKFSKLGLDSSRPVNEVKELIQNKLAAMDAQQLWDEGYVNKAVEEDQPVIKRSIVVMGIRGKLLRIAARLDTNSELESAMGHVIERIRENYVPDESWWAAMGGPLLNWHIN